MSTPTSVKVIGQFMQAVLWFGQCYHLCKTASPLMLLAILTDLRTMDLFWSVRFPWAKKTSAWLQWACKESLRSWSFRLILSCLTLPKTRCAAQSCVLTYPFLSDPSEDHTVTWATTPTGNDIIFWLSCTVCVSTQLLPCDGIVQLAVIL